MRLRRCLLATLSTASVLVVVGTSASGAAVVRLPLIRSVTFTGVPGAYSMDILGHGFGPPVQPVPFTGDTANFRAQDDAQLGQPGGGEWGFTGDGDQLTFASWTSNEIRVSGFEAAPGDAVFVAVQNALTGAGATWGGNIPVTGPGTPVVTGVHVSNLRPGTEPRYLRVVVTGSGFGPAPAVLAGGPFTGDLDQFYLWDGQVRCGGSSALSAGGRYFGVRAPDSVTLRYLSWSDTKIVISGFGGTYGTGCWRVHEGDAVTVNVWASTSGAVGGLQTARRAYLMPTMLRAPRH